MSDSVDSITDDLEVDQKRLSTLLDTSYPLLRILRERCPGTHKHSQDVSSIVEGVSSSLGLDVVFMKVCATYHDIGKTVTPFLYSENQLDKDNPHDKLEPWVSAQLIMTHVSHGINILINDPNFTRGIITVISQHHGNDLLRQFYNKTPDMDQAVFRYPGTKPQSVEAAILMISDHIEATCKAVIQNSSVDEFDPGKIIEKTISGLLDRGQLDEVTMRLGDLKKIKLALAKELEGQYQKRVDYQIDE